MPAGRFQEVVSREHCAVRTDVFCSRGKKGERASPAEQFSLIAPRKPAQEERRSRGSDGSRVPWHAGCRVERKSKRGHWGTRVPTAAKGRASRLAAHTLPRLGALCKRQTTHVVHRPLHVFAQLVLAIRVSSRQTEGWSHTPFLQINSELRNGRHLHFPAMAQQPIQQEEQQPQQLLLLHLILLPPRDPENFSGTSKDKVDTALAWYETQEAELTSWDIRKMKLV
ncbi:hypothetical protein HPB51_025588 [Rhipicephalus microplus]|uniref:Uncharacterized protein n=1 Tax=Rhipicephalus microplus TaxID=6941 RepID=A0A9J6DEF4_RHIMP|nr:hypothetical protein HPB51_025588 [Rhipicephalus microplus]